MIRRLCLVVLLVSSFLFCEENKFLLPDLFITAKNESKLNIDAKISGNADADWKAKWYVQPKDNDAMESAFLKDVKLLGTNRTYLYNEVNVAFGLHSYLNFDIYHGYVWNNMPYFLILQRTTGQKTYQADLLESGYFLGAISLDQQNIVNLSTYENNIKDAKLNSQQLGWKTFINYPILYTGKLFNANSFAGNGSVSFFENNLQIDLGNLNFLNEKYLSDFEGTFLFCNNNYFDTRLILSRDQNLYGLPHRLEMGLNPWISSGAFHLGLLLQDTAQVKLAADVTLAGSVYMGATPLEMDEVFSFTYAEINNTILLPDEKIGALVTLNNYFAQKEDIFLSLENYSNKKVWDDPDNDGYYSFENCKDVLVAKIGGLFKDISIYTEKIDLLLQLPLYSKDIPNQFDKLAEASYRKNIWGGELSTGLSYYTRELGKTNTGSYKNSYFDLKLNYDHLITTDFWWGVEVGNVLSAGSEKLTTHSLGDPYIYAKVRFIF